jgi:hypothetical protein
VANFKGTFHWEFASTSSNLDRWCPMQYFDDASRTSIEQVWANTSDSNFVDMPELKERFPDICSGPIYKTAYEKHQIFGWVFP